MKKEHILRIGFGMADITPLESVQLGGLGGPEGSRMSTEIIDPLKTICIAITDENDETVIFNVNDLCQIIDITNMREPTAQATGVPVDHIFLASTHTHSAPGIEYEMPEAKRYGAMVADRTAIAAAEAMRDRKPARLEIAYAYPENLNFCRRYVNTEGKIYNSTIKTMTMAGPESPADNQMQILRIVREGGKDIILTNFQSHHHGEVARNWFTGVSYNFFGVYRKYMEEKTGCHVAYFSGAGGNLAAGNLYEPHLVVATGYVDHGQRLGDYALKATDFKPLKTGPIQITRRTYTGNVRKSSPELVALAQKVREVSRTEGKEKAMAMLEGTPIDNLYHVGGICANAKLPDTITATLTSVAIGDWGIATAPCELYDTLGKQIKEGSPFEATMIFQLCNGSIGYIPSKIAYSHGGYEINTTKFQEGTGEGFRDAYLDMLKQMKEEQ